MYRFFKAIIILNTLLVILALLTGIQVLKTYNATRFGFNGIILSQGFLPYVYLTAMAYFLYFRDYLMIIILLIISALSGVKAVYAGEALFIFFLIISQRNLKFSRKALYILITFLLFGALLLIILSMPIFQDVINDDGWLTAIFSYRIENAFELLNLINGDNYNYIIGATDLNVVRLELQLIDIALFFGCLGVIIYAVFSVKFYQTHAISRISKVYFFSTLILSIFSGNLFYVPLSCILFFLTTISLGKEFKNKEFSL
ncbi:hypothetical protein Q2T40_18870 [Winogradskyella maritima]|uniref:O-antigen ligase-like membrane protein n=1 Tax=Winogradskyella maritima TaxID=1517766 RepID=A0ABV8AE21_9FLAO|nr:hypothetical protein [Winogradskyella maritima]